MERTHIQFINGERRDDRLMSKFIASQLINLSPVEKDVMRSRGSGWKCGWSECCERLPGRPRRDVQDPARMINIIHVSLAGTRYHSKHNKH